MDNNFYKQFKKVIEVNTTYIITEAVHPKVYYKINSNKSNTKFICALEDKSNIKFYADFKNKFLTSNESFIQNVEKNSIFLFPSEIRYECDKKLYELDLELSYNKK